ncbi:hypothetical protein Pint_07066 [Pistacia integerrima]|uniref:Uncharacterized protein n=1 Tax=Pistacia integerrima TaxID=434235 RepID=A0ACC0XV84_9ROSI|nr:hypothetical protein Pint_07066 [Pistacia integerrima]
MRSFSGAYTSCLWILQLLSIFSVMISSGRIYIL